MDTHTHTDINPYCVFIAVLERLDLECISSRNRVKDELDHYGQIFQFDSSQSDQNPFTNLKRKTVIWHFKCELIN